MATASSFLNFVGSGDANPSVGTGARPSSASPAKRQESVSACQQFLAGGSSAPSNRRTVITDENQRRKLAKEAYARIRRYMEDHDVNFNGAGEDGLPRIEQSWSIHHTDPKVRRANEDTLKGIAGIAPRAADSHAATSPLFTRFSPPCCEPSPCR